MTYRYNPITSWVLQSQIHDLIQIPLIDICCSSIESYDCISVRSSGLDDIYHMLRIENSI